MHTKTLTELSTSLHKGDISSVELTQHYLDRIKTHNNQLNAYITVCEDEALEQARAADKKIQQQTARKLTGIPIAHKDIFCTKGIRTSCASKMLDNFISPYNATVVEKVNTAGMVTLGKTNMDEFAMGSSNEYSSFGSVANPHNLDKVSGGSSGGSAAAVACNAIDIALGSDTGGSVRQPASFCGVYGFKPTYGRISRYGLTAFGSSLDQIGIFSKNTKDIINMFETISGHDVNDSTSSSKPLYKNKVINPHTLKIGYSEDLFNQLEPEIKNKFMELINFLNKAGVIIYNIKIKNLDLAIPTYYTISAAEASSNLARFDGIRYGKRNNSESIEKLFHRTRSEFLGEEVKRRILLGTYVLSSGYYDEYYQKALRVRRIITDNLVNHFNDIDLLLMPTTPSTAFSKGEKIGKTMDMYLSDIFTVPISLAGLPSLNIPLGNHNKMPFGIQISSNYFNENNILSLSNLIESKFFK